MENICKIELAGVVGRCTITHVGDSKVARFSLATNYTYNGKDGGIIIDTTWFSIIAWDLPELEKIQKGSKVHLIGRVRAQRYTDCNGCDHQSWEILAQELKIVED